MKRFVLTTRHIRSSLDRLADEHQPISDAIALVGYPDERRQPQGFETFARIIIGQQVSTSAARAIATKVEAAIGGTFSAEAIDNTDDQSLRGAGLSPQKLGYMRSLCRAVVGGDLDVDDLPSMADSEVVRAITAIKGFGEWSAHMYLMFSLGRPDIWPTGDLAVRAGFGRLMGMDERPTPKQTLLAAEPFKPYRSALSLLCWKYYSAQV